MDLHKILDIYDNRSASILEPNKTFTLQFPENKWTFFIRTNLYKQYIGDFLRENKISKERANSLEAMLDSESTSDQDLAITIIEQLQNQ